MHNDYAALNYSMVELWKIPNAAQAAGDVESGSRNYIIYTAAFVVIVCGNLVNRLNIFVFLH